MKEAEKVPWLALAIGVVSTGIGIWIGVLNANSDEENAGVYLIMAGILTTFGPVVVSHAVSKHLGREEAMESIRGQLDSISMNLGHGAATLAEALRRTGAGSQDPHVTMSIARNVVAGVEVQIDQLQKMIGSPFSTADFAATKRELVTLSELVSKAAEENDPEAVLEATRGIQKAVRSLVRPAPDMGTEEEVRCPMCANHVTVPVGEKVGSTAHARCDKCSAAFNVHRDRQGGLFVRVPRSSLSGAPDAAPQAEVDSPMVAAVSPAPVAPEPAGAPRQTSIECPSCAEQVRFWLDPSKPEQVVVCIACNTGITTSSSGPVLSHEPYAREHVAIERATKTGYIVTCPTCGKERPCKIRLNGEFFGYCSPDKLTLAVTSIAIQNFEGARAAPAV